MQHSPLQGRSILIVEDEPLIAFDIEMELAETGAGLTVTNVFDHALLLVEHDGLAAAVLDHAIGDDNSTCLYERLNERGIPFVIYSGHEVPEKDRRGAVFISKPAAAGELLAALEGLFSPR